MHRQMKMGTTMIVRVDDAPETIDLERAWNEVSPERRAHANSYRFERERRLSIAAYLLLKEALLTAYGISETPQLAHGPNGKPYLPAHPEIHFNLSHCARAAACVVADRPVGIDIETIAPIDWDVARRVLSDAELADVRTSEEPDVTFACHWTKKEAFVKMTGDGIDDNRLPTLLAHASDCRFETTVNRVRGYVLTTAMREA